MSDKHPLTEPLDALTREWFKGQIGDLADDELPPPDELEADIINMREGTLQRIMPAFESTDCTRNGNPDDRANALALERLTAVYAGLESATPIFTKLALSKVGSESYKSGWPLCAIRLIAETWLAQVQKTHEQWR